MSKLYRNNVLIWEKKYDSLYNMFIASSADAGTYFTYDGIQWKQTNALKDLKFTCICNGEYDASTDEKTLIAGTDNNGIWISTENNIWKQELMITGRCTSIAFGNGDYVLSIVGSNNTNNNGIWYKTSGNEWKKAIQYDGPEVLSLTWGKIDNIAIFVAGTTTGIYYSFEGAYWYKCLGDTANKHIETVQFSDTYDCIIAGCFNKVADGKIEYGGIFYTKTFNPTLPDESKLQWVESTLIDSFYQAHDGNWKTIVCAKDCILINSVDGLVGTWKSTDGGISWIRTIDNNIWNSISYGSGIYVGVQQEKVGREYKLGIMYSTDCMHWTPTNVTQPEFNVTQYNDMSMNEFMNGTTLYFKRTQQYNNLNAKLYPHYDTVGIKY